MGFWGYFRNELRWPLIHRKGPLSAIVEGLGRAMDDVREDILWLRKQFNPATCDEDYVPRHAASRGITRHRLESAAAFRERCKRAFAWHALGGGHSGLPIILDRLGYPGCGIHNMRDEDEDLWAEFKVRVPVTATQALDTTDYEFLTWATNDQKPARSVLAGLQTQGTVAATAVAGATLVLGTVVTLGPEVPGETSVEGSVRAGGYLHGISTATLGE